MLGTRLALLSACLAASAMAQSTTGTISGIVTDSSGASIAAADIQFLDGSICICRAASFHEKRHGIDTQFFGARLKA